MIRPPTLRCQSPSAQLGPERVRGNSVSQATQSHDACRLAAFFLSIRPILPDAEALSTRTNTHIAAIPSDRSAEEPAGTIGSGAGHDNGARPAGTST